LIQNIVVAVFIIEAALRLIAVYPRPQKYFRDGWNCFDFVILILSVLPTTGHFSTIARLIRLLRITRLITKSRATCNNIHASPLNTKLFFYKRHTPF
jgi:voltage-gated sodium channel